MSQTFELKPISKEGIPRAVELAERYRLLNDPEQAESICRDVLAVEPTHQKAVRHLILALTEQFAAARTSASRKELQELLDRLEDEYEKLYLTGLVCEREAHAYLGRGGHTSFFAYEGFREAMDWYEKAADKRPEGNDEPLLRWNSCARAIMERKLKPRPADDAPQLLE